MAVGACDLEEPLHPAWARDQRETAVSAAKATIGAENHGQPGRIDERHLAKVEDNKPVPLGGSERAAANRGVVAMSSSPVTEIRVTPPRSAEAAQLKPGSCPSSEISDG